MDKLSHRMLLMVFGLINLFGVENLSAQTTDLPYTASAISGDKVIYDFSFGYPEDWQVINLQGLEDVGAALASITERDGQPETLITLRVVSLQEAEISGDAIYPFPVQSFNLDAETVQSGSTVTAIRRGTLFDGRTTFIASQTLESRNIAVLQAAVPLDILPENEALFLAILNSVRLDDVRVASSDSGTTSDLCNYDVTVTIDRIQVMNAEEAGTGADFDFDGDQISLTAGLGPILDGSRVDTGLQEEFQTIWEADLTSRQIVEGGSVVSIQRVLCESEVGFQLELTEDDSTPFRHIETRLGGRVVLPVLTNGEPSNTAGVGEYTFSGNTQDGNFEYYIHYTVAYTPITIRAIDLTPTLPPTPTFTSSATFTATVTSTPSATLSPVPTNTPTPTDTPTPTLPPTIDGTRAAAEFAATQTAFAITQTAVIATYTPSRTATLEGQDAFFATQTAFAVTQNAFLTQSAPTRTSSATPTRTMTASATFTPSATFTASQTFTSTPQPSKTNVPSPTATATPLPTVTATPTPLVCPGSLESRLYGGTVGRVVPGSSANRLRAQASLTASQITLIPAGEEFIVVGGPVCADDFTWVQVEYQGDTGWTVEGDGQVYWLEPLTVRGSEISIPTISLDICLAIAEGIVNKRNGPGTSFDLRGQMQSGEQMQIVGQQTSTSGFIWWKLIDETWVREDTVRESGDCAVIPRVA